jgi:acetylornithine deacetylase
MDTILKQRLLDYVDARQDRLVTLISELVRRPSENKPPIGSEGECQRYIASMIRAAALTPDVYGLDSVAGLTEHPLFWGDRIYTDRPNVAARRPGLGGGRSLLLSSHIDTVPRGTLPWTRDPFGAEIEGNRLYGRGSNDMKAGAAMNLFILEAAQDLELPLRGDLLFESVVDEEFGGVNGTLAGRLRGYIADAAILTEPSSLRICAAQRGGRTVHITFSSQGGILANQDAPARVMDQVAHFIKELDHFAEQRRNNCRPHTLYANTPDPVPVAITKITTGPWGTGEPISLPEICKIELYWQLMPGEEQEEVEREFSDWMTSMMKKKSQLFRRQPLVQFPMRWLPGSAISASEPLVTELAQCAAMVLPETPVATGLEAPCDMFVFHQFKIPTVVWGPSGGNTHGADEYVELDSVVLATKALLLFLCRWCGLDASGV